MRFWIALLLLGLKEGCLKLSSILGTLVVVILKPKDLERLTQRFYHQQEAVGMWGNPAIIEEGLHEGEEFFVKEYLKGNEKCLVLCCGGGRETVALAQKGFQVKGVDWSTGLIEKARTYAAEKGLSCDYVAQDLHELSLGERFDAILLGSNMYSAIPLKERRIHFLKRVREHLEEGGLFFVKFATGVSPEEMRHYPLKKLIATLLGNRNYELGDTLFAGWHYQHAFVKESDLRREIEESGFQIDALHFNEGYAVLRG